MKNTKKIEVFAIVLLLTTSIVAQSEASYFYPYVSYTHADSGNKNKQKQKIKIKIKGDDNTVYANQFGYIADVDNIDVLKIKEKAKIKIKGENNIILTQQNSEVFSIIYPIPPYPYPFPQPIPQPNQAPVWFEIPDQTVYAGNFLNFSVFATDPDSSSLTYSVVGPANSNFNPNTRQFSWVPNSNQIGIHNVIFRVSDGAYVVDMSVVITVLTTGSNNPPGQQLPVWTEVPDQTVIVNQNLQFTVFASSPHSIYLTYSVVNLPAGAYFDAQTRRFNWTPNSNQVGNYNVTFRVSDGYYTVDMVVEIHVIITNYPYPYPYPNPNSYPAVPTFTSPLPIILAREGQVYTHTVHAVCTNNFSVTYRVANGPDGLTINPTTGVIVWIPNYNQGRSEFYPVTIAASCGGAEATQTFYVVAVHNNVYTPPPVYIPPTTYYPPAIHYPKNYCNNTCIEKLVISNLKVESMSNGDILVFWDTNRPATSRVIFDITSQTHRTKDFSYVRSTSEDNSQFVTRHMVNLGLLENNRTYYLRAVSRTDNDQTAYSSEVSFAKLGSGAVAGTTGFASIFYFLGSVFFQPWILLLLIIILLIMLVRTRRDLMIVK